jgi:hypothetical protein
LNGGGLRVDSKEAQGLFNKTATAEGLSSNLAVGSGSDGSGAFRFRRSDLNSVVRTVRSGSDGPIWLGARGRRVCTAAHAGVCMFAQF